MNSVQNNRRILAVIEGEHTEQEILLQLQNSGLLRTGMDIFVFSTNIFNLLRHLQISDESGQPVFDEIDIRLELKDLSWKQLMVVVSRADDHTVHLFQSVLNDIAEKDDAEISKTVSEITGQYPLLKKQEPVIRRHIENIKALSGDFGSTILLFDAEPHIQDFNSNQIRMALERFNSISDTDYGKLYLSYPMIEALFDEDRIASLEGYKSQSSVQTSQSRLLFGHHNLSSKDWQEILHEHERRAERISGEPVDSPLLQINLFEKQLPMIAEKRIQTVSTALFFLNEI